MALFLFSMSLFALYMTERMGKSFSTQKRRAEQATKQSINSMLVDGIDCCKTLEFAKATIDASLAGGGTFSCEPQGTVTSNPLMYDSGVFVNSARELAFPDRWYRSIEPLYSGGESILKHATAETDDIFPGYYLQTQDVAGNVSDVGMNVDLRCSEVDKEDGSPLYDSSGERVIALMMHAYTKRSNLETALDQTLPRRFDEIGAVAACWPIFKCGWEAKCGVGHSYKGDKTVVRDLRANPNYILNPCDNGPLTLFVSPFTTDGSIEHNDGSAITTGVEAADKLCQDAGDAEAPGTWYALLSTVGVRAKDRVDITSVVNNNASTPLEIAADYKELWEGLPKASLSYTADPGDTVGTINPIDAHVWTGSTADSNGTASNCGGWNSASNTAQGTFGEHGSIGNTDWLSSGSADCDQQKRIYCMGYFD